MKLIFKSSNKYKIAEYTRYFNKSNMSISVEAGKDIKEVQGTPLQVILYKAKAAGKNVIVEDTVLEVNGEMIVDIRWKQDNLETGDQVKWFINIGVMDDNFIKVYSAHIDLVCDRSYGTDGYAFEPYLIPLKNNPNRLSYTELSKVVDKATIDPRALAIEKLFNDKPTIVYPVSQLKEWTGKYQNS